MTDTGRGAGVDSAARSAGSVRSRAVERLAAEIRTEILGGALAPGRPLREEELADRHRLSRHTVRAALAQLAGERLVTAEPYRGVRVTVFGDEQVLALQDLRRALESEAVRIIGARVGGGSWPSGERAAIDDAVERLDAVEQDPSGDWSAVERAHADVHLALVESAGSPRITEAYRTLAGELALLLLHTRPAYEKRRLAAEHRAFLEDVQRRGVDAVRDHLAESTRLLLDRAAADPVG